MRIDAVTLYRVPMDLVVPHRTTKYQVATLEHVLVRVDGGGVVGWGECAAPTEPYYLGETVGTSWHMLEEFLVPSILGRTWETIEELVELYAPVKGNTFPKAALEMAAWDLLGRAKDMSVAALLGGTRSDVAAGVTIGAGPDRERLMEQIERALGDGYTRIKLKIGPGHDIEMLDAVRSRFPDAPLMVDANSAYTIADLDHLRQVDAFGLMMIEQPFGPSEFLEHAQLQRAIATPVCLDESIRSLEDARLALALESCRIVCVKVASVGGLLAARRIHDLCGARGAGVWCGGMLDYGTARAANIALASLPGFTMPSDVAGSARYFVEDVVDPPITSAGGRTLVPSQPGLGHDVVASAVERRATAQRRFFATTHLSS